MGYLLKSILSRWKKQVGGPDVIQYKISTCRRILTIYTSKPGMFVGKSGCNIEKYLSIIKDLGIGIDTILFSEVDDFII